MTNDERAELADELAHYILENQTEIMGAVSLLLRYAQPDLVGKAGELDRQRDDLLQRHKATQAALSHPNTGGKSLAQAHWRDSK